MKIFYKNLQRISRGDWWIHPKPDSILKYGRKVRHPGFFRLLPEHDKPYFEAILRCLTYDLVGFENTFPEECRAEIMHRTVKNSIVEKKRKELGATMPAQRFLEVYNEMNSFSYFSSSQEDAKETKWLKNNIKMQAFKTLREDFHK